MAEPYDEDPLVRALRVPGTPGELADQEHYRAMFRETRGGGNVTPLSPGSPRRPGGRAARRFGAGTTLSIVIAVAGGGVAAAYTGSLPEPLQNFAHTVLGPVNVPPSTPPPDRLDAAPDPAPGPAVEESPSATPTDSEPTPDAESSKPAGDGPKPSQEASPTDEPTASSSDTPTATPTDTPTDTPTPTPTTPTPSPTSTPTPTASPSDGVDQPTAVPASLSITGSTHKVEYAAAPEFSGVVTSDEGTAVAEVQVALLQRQDGVWRRVAFATSDESGEVSMSAPPIYANTSLRFKTEGARSKPWRVNMHPELTLSPSASGDTVTLVASAAGGRQGDLVRLNGVRDGQAVLLATGILGLDGTVTFQVVQEAKKARYAALLEASDVHTADRTVVVVTKPKTPKDDNEESPSPSPSAVS